MSSEGRSKGGRKKRVLTFKILAVEEAAAAAAATAQWSQEAQEARIKVKKPLEKEIIFGMKRSESLRVDLINTRL